MSQSKQARPFSLFLKRTITDEFVKLSVAFLAKSPKNTACFNSLKVVEKELVNVGQKEFAKGLQNFIEQQESNMHDIPLQSNSKLTLDNQNVFNENGSEFINYLNGLKLNHDDSFVDLKESEAKEGFLTVDVMVIK